MTAQLPITTFFESVAHVWVIGTIALALWIYLTRRAVNHLRRGDLWRLLAREEGAAYTMSYVLTFPIYMLTVCVVIQSGLILVTKTGTVYAAYAAGRSAVVWLNAQPNLADEKIKQAATTAMAPFASSRAVDFRRVGGSANSGATNDANRFVAAYKKYAPSAPATPKYLAAKYRMADVATSVAWEPERPTEHQDVILTLKYRMPLHIPGAARVLGYANGICEITSRVTLQNEGAKKENGQNPQLPLGIDYRSDR